MIKMIKKIYIEIEVFFTNKINVLINILILVKC